MRFRIPLTIAGAAVLATTLLHGMETQGIPDQVRKGSDYLVGNWIGEGTAEDQPATMRLSVRWARGEQHQVYEWSISQRGGETVYGNAVGGLDRGRNQWVEQMMESDGSHWTNRWDPVAGDSVEEVEFHGEQTIRHDGKEIQAKLTVQRKGPDEWHYTVAGTEGKPNILSMAFKRTPEKPDKATAARLEDLAWLIGDWEGEFELPSGFDEVGPAGAKVRSFESWRWGLGKKFIFCQWREEVDGKHTVTSHYVVGPNLETGELSTWFFESLGSHGTGTWRLEGDKFVLPWRSITPGGRKYQGVSDSVRVDDDTYIWQVRDVTESGKRQTDWPKVTLKRKKPTAGVTADDFIEYHKPLLGSWKAIAEEDGKSYAGTAKWETAAGEKCVLVEVKLEGRPAVQALMGYDPVDGKWHQMLFDGDGMLQLGALTIEDMKKGKAMSKGFIGNWEEKLLKPDGTVATGTATFACTEISKDRITFVWSNRKEGGKSLPDWKLTYQRP